MKSNPKDKRKQCEEHGCTIFRYRCNKKSEWWVCLKCLREQWKKATKKRMKKPEVKKYIRDYHKNMIHVRSLSIYLTMILLVANIKPE